MSNTKLSERYLALARDMDVMEPKLPEDVYKMHLVDTHRSALAPGLDSAAKNLSATLVNALVNVGFGTDKLVTVEPSEGSRPWVSRNKDQGKTCAVASIGVCIFLLPFFFKPSFVLPQSCMNWTLWKQRGHLLSAKMRLTCL
jgi:26S proteasome regulatory subunit N1